ncbi:MAG: mevalonate kinase [Candidatus Thermoplasmatota archaeon]
MNVKASAPGKVILFGEHAVVYGEPSIALAVNKRSECEISLSDSETTVNGYPIQKKYHSYILECLERLEVDRDLEINTDSELPSGAGMGSSAAISVATLGSLRKFLKRDTSEEAVAKDAFKVEFGVQGSASPIDTSTSTHGSAIMVSEEKEEDFLWDIERDEKRWNIHHKDIPDLDLVIGNTGVHSPTAPLVKKVRKFYEKSNFAKEIIHDIGELVREGSTLLEEEDIEGLGHLMNKNHRLLSILGVSHPKLEKLIKGARRYSYGAKLTGAGGGGSMIALTDRPEKVAEVIQKNGGEPYVLNSTDKGLSYDNG